MAKRIKSPELYYPMIQYFLFERQSIALNDGPLYRRNHNLTIRTNSVKTYFGILKVSSISALFQRKINGSFWQRKHCLNRNKVFDNLIVVLI